jgi:threonine/homoserine/homoserine lactone efflux protein
MESIKNANALNALVIALGLSGLNPKNLMFNLSAGTAIASATSAPRDEMIAWTIYIVLASLTVLGPVGWFLVAPEAAATHLDQPRQWLIDNSTALVAVTVLLIGVSQIGKGIAGLG